MRLRSVAEQTASRPVGKPAGRNVFEVIENIGHDEDFEPDLHQEGFEPTDAPPGSDLKKQILKERVQRGFPLHHILDRRDYIGCTPGVVRPWCG